MLIPSPTFSACHVVNIFVICACKSFISSNEVQGHRKDLHSAATGV
jgi:hypothetical protein